MNTLTQTSLADAQAELDERYEAWCELAGADPSAVGTWERFDRENA